MKEQKLQTITNLFKGKKIRSTWNKEKEDYYFSVIDVISALTNSPIPKRYWTDLKRKLYEEGSELYENIVQLKMKSEKDGKHYTTDVLNTKGILRLIQSVPSPKAEPFKLWLASLGKERIDEVFDPEIAIKRAINYYKKKGYNDDWIRNRINGILKRKKLTDIWKENGITKSYEYAALTNEIYKTWSGRTSKEYKEYKGLKKENLRDNMTDIEIILTDLGEITTRDIAKVERPLGLKENKQVAKRGGKASKIAKDYYEKETREKAISNENNIAIRYFDGEKEKIK